MSHHGVHDFCEAVDEKLGVCLLLDKEFCDKMIHARLALVQPAQLCHHARDLASSDPPALAQVQTDQPPPDLSGLCPPHGLPRTGTPRQDCARPAARQPAFRAVSVLCGGCARRGYHV